MSALGNYWRLQIKNTTGGASSATATTVTGRRWKPGASGEADFEASETTFLTQGSIASGGVASGTAYDNDAAGEGYYGLAGLVTIVNGSSAGNYEVRIQFSPDGGTKWPDNGLGIPVAVIYCAASATVKQSINIR